MKIVGGILLFAATIVVNINDQEERRQMLMFLMEMKSALGDVASQVRWKNLPLPDCMAAQIQRPQAGPLFENALEMMNSGMTLQEAWYRAIRGVKNAPVKEMLLYLDWQGDTQRLLGNLGYTQEQLEQIYAQERAANKERRKLVWAVSLSICGMLIIVML